MFNLNYLKSGGNVRHETEKQLASGGSMSFLPKIKHTSVESPYPPKEREKIKEGRALILELRKRFDEKLRT